MISEILWKLLRMIEKDEVYKMDGNKYSHDVFISFSFKDQSFAENIVNILSSTYGISCWICTRDIDGGKRYKKLIPEV